MKSNDSLQNGNRYLVRIIKVEDGDTIVFAFEDNGKKQAVRLIGINTPETEKFYEKVNDDTLKKAKKVDGGYIVSGEPYAEEAKEVLQDLLLAKEVSIEFDVDPLDEYGRFLCYIYRTLPDGTELFVNDYLVQQGAARVYPFFPNTKHKATFQKSQQEAIKKRLGMWDHEFWRFKQGLNVADLETEQKDDLTAHHLRIGDTTFLLPPEAIRVTKKGMGQSVPVIRGDGSYQQNSGQYEFIIDISITFPTIESINQELRPLLAQLKKCPFLPIENQYLNETLLIEAVTVNGLTVTTIPDFPSALSCQMQFYAFDYAVYIGYQNDSIKPFREYFNWKLFRWFYQRNLNPAKIVMDPATNMPMSTNTTYYEPLTKAFDNIFRIKTPLEADLIKIRNWKKIRNKVIGSWHADKAKKPFFDKEDYEQLWNDYFGYKYGFSNERQMTGFEQLKDYNQFFDSKDEQVFLKNLDLVLALEMKEYDIAMEDWFVQVYDEEDLSKEIKPKITIANLTVGINNIISSQQLRGTRFPVHQYLGSQDSICEMTLLVEGEQNLSVLHSAFDQATRLSLEYSTEISCSFIEFDHPLLRLFNIRNVTIQDFMTSTVDGMPGVFEVQISMIAYNRLMQKKLELQSINTAQIRPDVNLSLTNDYQAAAIATGTLAVAAISLFINPFVFWASIGASAYYINKWFQSTPLYNGRYNYFFNDNELDDLDVRKNAIYEKQVENYLDHINLYPDLELPTYAEVYDAGFSEVVKSTEGLFVDPDFYFLYDAVSPMRQLNDMIEKNGLEARLIDKLGHELHFDKEGNPTYSESLQTFSFEMNRMKENEMEKFDYKNVENQNPQEQLNQEQIESMIRMQVRKLNQQYGLIDSNAFPEELAISFVRFFDPLMRQYYSTGSNSDLLKFNEAPTETALFVPIGERIPILMDQHARYHTNIKLIEEMSYIGVMRISPKISNYTAKDLAFNTQLNIEEAIMRMVVFWMNADQAILDTNPSMIGKYFNEIIITDTRLKAIFIIMQYMGLNVEWTNLKKGYKFFNAWIVVMLKSIIIDLQGNQPINPSSQAKVSKNWDQIYQTIPKKDLFGETARLYSQVKAQFDVNEEEIKALAEANASRNEKLQEIEEKYFIDPKFRIKSMFTDMIKYDMRGRIARAFPTFALVFINEGRYFSAVKMADQYFNYQAINSINYLNSRKMATSTLTLELNNINGSLTDASKAQDLKNRSIGELWKMFMNPKQAAAEAEKFTRDRHPSWYKSIYLRTGARVHFRMGFGGSFQSLPVIMNGVITQIENDADKLFITVQDDGIELLNKLKVDVNGTTEGYFFSNREPTQIVDDILRDDRHLTKGSIWAKQLSNEEYLFHSYGLMHFGNPGSPVAPWFHANRKIAENNINVYKTTGGGITKPDGWSTLWDQFGMTTEDEPNFCFFLYDKTVWDVLNTCAATADDYVVAVHPFLFRNTIFSGSPLFPIKHGYRIVKRREEDIESDKLLYQTSLDMEWEENFFNTHDVTYEFKTYRQIHLFDSTDYIIENNIKATEENLFTVVIPTYTANGLMKNTDPIYVDTDIYPEKQKTTYVDTTMDSRGLPLLDYIPLIGELLNAPFRYMFDERVSIKIGASALKDFMKDMYDGHLLVAGYPMIKPYDQVFLDDSFTRMNGMFEVKEVYHQFNFQSGFVTMIKPDLICVTNDSEQIRTLPLITSTLAALVLQKTINYKLHQLGHLSTMPIFEFFKKTSGIPFQILKDNILGENIWEKFKTSDTYKKISDNMSGDDIENFKKTFDNWKKSGALNEILQKLDEMDFTSHVDYLDAIDRNVSQRTSRVYNESKKYSMMRKIMAGTNFTLTKSFAKLGKTMMRVFGLVTGPLGWVVEFFVVELLIGSIAELINRFLFTRQALIMMPMKQDGLPLYAGISGHRGSVKGDPGDLVQNFFYETDLGKFIFGFSDFIIGTDTNLYGPNRTSEEEQLESGVFSIPSESTRNDYELNLFMEYVGHVKDEINRRGGEALTEEEKKQLLMNRFRAKVEVDVEYAEHYQKRVEETQKENAERYRTQTPESVNQQTDTTQESKQYIDSYGSQAPSNYVEQAYAGYLTSDIGQIKKIDLRTPSGMSAQAFDAYFKGSVYEGIGRYFVELEQDGIDFYADSMIEYHPGKTDAFAKNPDGTNKSFWHSLIDDMWANANILGIPAYSRSNSDWKKKLPDRKNGSEKRLRINGWFLAALMQSEFSYANFHSHYRKSCIKNRFNFFGLYAFDNTDCKYAIDFRGSFFTQEFINAFGYDGYGNDENGKRDLSKKPFYEVPGSIGRSQGMREELQILALYLLVKHITPGAKFFTSTPDINGFVRYATSANKRDLISKVMSDIAKFEPKFKLIDQKKASGLAKGMQQIISIDANTFKSANKIGEFQYAELKQKNSRLVRIPFETFNGILSGLNMNKETGMLIRPSTLDRIKEMLTILKAVGLTGSIEMLEAFSNKNPNSWHATGYAFDVYAPGAIQAGNDNHYTKNKQTVLNVLRAGCKVGFNGIICGSLELVNQMKKEYPNVLIVHNPAFWAKVQFSHHFVFSNQITTNQSFLQEN